MILETPLKQSQPMQTLIALSKMFTGTRGKSAEIKTETLLLLKART